MGSVPSTTKHTNPSKPSNLDKRTSTSSHSSSTNPKPRSILKSSISKPILLMDNHSSNILGTTTAKERFSLASPITPTHPVTLHPPTNDYDHNGMHRSRSKSLPDIYPRAPSNRPPLLRRTASDEFDFTTGTREGEFEPPISISSNSKRAGKFRPAPLRLNEFKQRPVNLTKPSPACVVTEEASPISGGSEYSQWSLRDLQISIDPPFPLPSTPTLANPTASVQAQTNVLRALCFSPRGPDTPTPPSIPYLNCLASPPLTRMACGYMPSKAEGGLAWAKMGEGHMERKCRQQEGTTVPVDKEEPQTATSSVYPLKDTEIPYHPSTQPLSPGPDTPKILSPWRIDFAPKLIRTLSGRFAQGHPNKAYRGMEECAEKQEVEHWEVERKLTPSGGERSPRVQQGFGARDIKRWLKSAE